MLVFLVFFSAPGFAADVYIDPSGANGDGTFATPYDSLDRVDGAFSNANDYYIKCGTTDTLPDDLDIANIVGTAGNRVIIGCYYGEGSFDRTGCLADSALPIIKENGDTNTIELFKIADCDYLTIQNLDLREGKNHIELSGDNNYIIITYNNIGEACTNWGIRAFGTSTYFDISYNTIDTKMATYGQVAEADLWDAIKLLDTTNSEVHHNTIKDWGHNAIAFDDNSDNNKFYNNYVTGTVTTHMRAFAIVYGADNNEVYNNWFDGLTCEAKLMGTGNVAHHNIFSNYRTPTFEGVVEQGTVLTVSGLGGNNVDGIKFYNNTLYNIPGAGVQTPDWLASNYGTVSNIEITNNLFIDVGTDYNATGDPSQDYDYAIYVASYDERFFANKYQNNVFFTTDRAATVIKYRDGGEMSATTFNTSDEGTDTVSSNVDSSSGNNMTDPGNDDFTLKVGADAINAGINLGAAYDDGWNPSTPMPPAAVTTVDQDYYDAWEPGNYTYVANPPSEHLAISNVNSGGLTIDGTGDGLTIQAVYE